jgi:Protein of unknown function (DUF3667)
VSQEIEAAAGDALGGFFRLRKKPEHTAPLGEPCPNCATPLQGPWCYNCGQLAEDFHRSIWRLIGEVFEGLLHFDGRVWTTLPDLFRHPARLTRNYLEGHRAPQIPPFRLFLVVLVTIFLAGSITGHTFTKSNTTVTDSHGNVTHITVRTFKDLTPAEREQTKASLVGAKLKGHGGLVTLQNWLLDRVGKALDDPARFELVLGEWAERFAFLTLPMAAGLLTLAFLGRKEFYVFDHTIFSLHSLSAVGLMYAANELFAGVTFGLTGLVLTIGAPVHLFVHMRGVYRTSVIGTLLRMLLLAIGSLFGATLIVLGLVLMGLNGMGE